MKHLAQIQSEFLEISKEAIIRKLPNGKYRLYSKKKHKNLGTFGSHAKAVKHEQQVEYFKHRG
jgi:hypothetical protein